MSVSDKQTMSQPASDSESSEGVLAPKCTYAIQREKTWLDGRVVYEYVPEPNRFKAMKLLAQEVIEARKEKHLEQLKARGSKKSGFSSIKEQNECYYRQMRRDTKLKKVTLTRAKHGWGRVMADDSCTFACMERYSRNTILEDYYADFDIENCQATIILGAAMDEGDDCSAIEEFCEKRSEIIAKGMEKYGKTRDEIKGVWTALINGGGIPSWYKSTLAHRMAEECKIIRAKVKQANPELYESMRQKMLADVEKMKKYGGDAEKTQEAVLRSMWAFWFQHHEVRIVSAVLEWAHKEGLLTLEGDAYKDKVIFSYIYDGFVLLRSNLEKWATRTGKGQQAMLDAMRNVVYEKTGFAPVWKVKPFEEKYDISEEMISVMAAPVQCEAKKLTGDMSFEAMTEEFEKTNCKIYNSGVFVQKNPDGTNSIRSLDKLKVQNGHLWCGYDDKGKKINFINAWTTNNTEIRMYQYMDVYPNESKCPLDTYNLWVPFAMERVEEFKYNEDGLKEFQDFIKYTICGHLPHHKETPQYDYMIKWMAHLMQKPDKKVGKCPILISKQGGGKGTLVEMMKKIMGAKKVFESVNPARDVFGDFNHLMEEAVLVVLDECGKGKINAEAQETFKNFITGGKMTINQKHCPQYEITSRHAFLITTNDESGGVYMSEGDRRFFVLRMSDARKGDTDYWKKMYAMLEDEDVSVWKTIYDWLMVQDLSGDWKENTPKTEFQKNLESSNKSALDCWMEDMVAEWARNLTKRKSEITMTGEEVLADYNGYCERNGYKGKEVTTNSGGLSAKLNNHEISRWGGKPGKGFRATEVQRGGKCNHRVFRLNEMWNYYVEKGVFKSEDLVGPMPEEAPAELPEQAAPTMIKKIKPVKQIKGQQPLKLGAQPDTEVESENE